MSSYRRPWWLVVNKPVGLVTTVEEDSNADEQVFIIRGKPLIHGLSWLIWGPAGALLVILLLTWLAIAFHIREQTSVIRGLYIAAFLGLPALAWGVIAKVFNLFSEKHLQTERRAEAQECIIRLNQKQGELSYQTPAHPTQKTVAYNIIRRARVTHAIGKRGSNVRRLTLETNEGPIVLLDETLGTQAQKVDLADRIQQALDFR